MKRPIAYCLFAVILMLACAPSPKPLPDYSYSPGTRVGIVNMLETQATHKHFSSIRIDSFTKTYDVNWNIPKYVTDRLTKVLQGDGRYTVLAVNKKEFEDWIILQRGSSDPANSGNLKPEFTNKLESLSAQHGLDVILVISSFNGPSPHKLGKTPIELEGYGVFSRSVAPLILLPFKSAYSYAQISISVFKSDPVRLIATGKPKLKKSSIRGFDWSHGAKNVPVSEIDKALPGVRKYAQKAVKRALQAANLIPSQKSSVTDSIDAP
jgi:hypothetical protein